MQNGCRWFIERLIAAPALAALMALSLPAPAHAQQVVKIAKSRRKLVPSTPYGWMSAQGMSMAVAEINNVGGFEVAGKQYKLELVNPDTQGNPQQALIELKNGRDEEIPEKAGAAPTPPIGAADNSAIGFAQKQREQFSVRNTGRLNIELIKASFE